MKLGRMIAMHRAVNKLTMRKAAEEIGILASTLCRFENSKEVNVEAFLKILAWVTK